MKTVLFALALSQHRWRALLSPRLETVITLGKPPAMDRTAANALPIRETAVTDD